MRLDHDSSQLSGEVLDGPYRGRELTSLTLNETLALLAQCRQEDPQGAQALETFLDRQHGDDWRRQGDAEDGAVSSAGGGSERPRRLQHGFGREELVLMLKICEKINFRYLGIFEFLPLMVLPKSRYSRPNQVKQSSKMKQTCHLLP